MTPRVFIWGAGSGGYSIYWDGVDWEKKEKQVNSCFGQIEFEINVFVTHILNCFTFLLLLSKMLIPFPFLASLGKRRPIGYYYIVCVSLIRPQLVSNFFLSPLWLVSFFSVYLRVFYSPFSIMIVWQFSLFSFNRYLLSNCNVGTEAQWWGRENGFSKMSSPGRKVIR